MVKRFSTVRETQRGSQSYMKKRRGRREIEVTRRRRRGIERGESSLASNQFPICSLTRVWNTQRGSRSSTEKRKERKEIEVPRRRGGVVKRRDQSSLWSVPCFLHRPEYPKRVTELSREDKGEGGHRGDLGEIKESQKGRGQLSQ